jgi:ubiquinone/menaquinone biosynthesis C-methylase UbiE
MWSWLVLGIGLILVGLFLYWALITTEGSYLGARVVALTYDLTARHYDQIKQFDPIHDVWLLAIPMLQALGQIDCPLLLDVATGTGRMPEALLQRPQFDGTIVGLDLSFKMLQQAEAKLRAHRERYSLICQNAQKLPFPDESFDAVSCLEALEFMPSPQRVIAEMNRVLRPGGILLITNRVNWERKLMPGKAFSDDGLRAILEQAGLAQIDIRPWQVYYDLIWARKAGSSSRLGRGTHALEQLLRCPRCEHRPLARTAASLACLACGTNYAIEDHIVRLAR